MNILNALHQLLGQHQQQGAPLSGQAHKQMPLSPALQHLMYAQYKNPDGSGGGFGPNNPSQLQVHPNAYRANLGVPTGNQVQMGQLRQRPQAGDFNPGFTPLQNSGFGPRGNPQAGAMNLQDTYQVNPQNNPYQQYWN